jgi:hypothetical protein
MSHRDELLRAFRIGPGDIHANRAGRLGERQVARLRRSVWINVAGTAVFQLGLVAVGYFIAPRAVVSWVVLGLVFALFTALGVRWIRQLRRVMRDGTVRCLVGRVTVQSAQRGGTWLVVQGERNRLWTAYWHVGRGREYRVYVAPAAKLIVAMEPEGWG